VKIGSMSLPNMINFNTENYSCNINTKGKYEIKPKLIKKNIIDKIPFIRGFSLLIRNL